MVDWSMMLCAGNGTGTGRRTVTPLRKWSEDSSKSSIYVGRLLALPNKTWVLRKPYFFLHILGGNSLNTPGFIHEAEDYVLYGALLLYLIIAIVTMYSELLIAIATNK